MIISELLALMGSRRIREKGFETTASCPFAPWTHEKGRDMHPSFGVNMLLNDGHGVYHCFACGKSGTVRSMIEEYCKMSGIPTSRFEKFINEIESEYTIDMSLIKKKAGNEFVVPEDELNFYREHLKMSRYHQIFKDNNITPGTVQRWEIAVSDDKVIFPVKNRLDNILFFVYRWIKKGGPKYTVSQGAKTKSAIYGANMVNVLNDSPLIVVEGILDAIYIEQLGFNSVAIFGVFINDKQVDMIRSISPSDSIAIVFDDDEAGRDGVKYVEEKLSKYFYSIKTMNVPAVRMLDTETLSNLVGGCNYVREYF